MIDSLKNIQAEKPHEKLDCANNGTFVEKNLCHFPAGHTLHVINRTRAVSDEHLGDATRACILRGVASRQICGRKRCHVERVEGVRWVGHGGDCAIVSLALCSIHRRFDHASTVGDGLGVYGEGVGRHGGELCECDQATAERLCQVQSGIVESAEDIRDLIKRGRIVAFEVGTVIYEMSAPLHIMSSLYIQLRETCSKTLSERSV